MVSVRCPAGTGPGDTVRIPHGGQLFDVKVPAGAMPDSVFQVQLPLPQNVSPQPTAGGIYSGTGAAYPGLQAAAAASPQSAAARAQMNVLNAVAPAPAPSTTVRSQKLQMSMALVAGSVSLDGNTLSCTLKLGVSARLAVWHGIPRTPQGSKPPGPADLPTLATSGASSGKPLEFPAGDARSVVVELDGGAMDTLLATADAQLCPVVLCLEASDEQPAATGVTVRALIVWLGFAGNGSRALGVVAQYIYTSTGQGARQGPHLVELAVFTHSHHNMLPAKSYHACVPCSYTSGVDIWRWRSGRERWRQCGRRHVRRLL